LFIRKFALQDAELIRYFKEVDALPQDDQNALLRVIAGFIRNVKTKQAYACVTIKPQLSRRLYCYTVILLVQLFYPSPGDVALHQT
jgi:hypothetical protein